MDKTLEWTVQVHISEEEGTTKARMELDTGTQKVTGRGTARCNPGDVDVPTIGDELAVGRASNDLAQKLLRQADSDMAGVGAAPTGRGTGWTNTGA